MRLHIFNPEHDMALAANQSQYTPSHAGRGMRHDLAFLPALWADEGDGVLVEDAGEAMSCVRHLSKVAAKVHFVTADVLPSIELTGVDAWGWDKSVVHDLMKKGVPADLLPTAEQLDFIRKTSHRRWAATSILPHLQRTGVTGQAFYAETVDEMQSLVLRFGKAVVKAPWSGSGRGIRYVDSGAADSRLLNWATNVVSRQGGVMVEPYYNKVKDFGAEFRANGDTVEYLGLSLFKTINGAYAGNVVATEEEKVEMLQRYIDKSLYYDIVKDILSVAEAELLGRYNGYFGVDMMVVAGEEGFLLHPCVELNLRRTMGHVALSLRPRATDPQRLMRVYFDGRYHFRIVPTHENVVDKDIY